MATEQDHPPDNGVLKAQAGTDRPASRQPLSWKIDILSLALSVISLGAIVGLLAYYDGSFRAFWFWPQSHWLRFGLGCLLSAIYLLLWIPLSNSLYRIKQIHHSYPSWVFTSDQSPAKLRKPVRAIRTFFTSKVFGIAPAPALILLVAATAAVGLWTNTVVEYRRINAPKPKRFERRGGANLAVARRLDAGAPKEWPSYVQRETLQTAVWKGFTGAAAENSAQCFGYAGYYGAFCKWEGYATLQVRVQCGDISQHLELSSAYSIFNAMRDLESLPPYDPRHESQANHSSPSVMSLKGNTFVTLSNLRSYTEPWDRSTDKDFEFRKGKPRQISKEALKKLGRFSSLVVNPVDGRKLNNPLYNQTAGVLGNFHIIWAELGIAGFYGDDGELEWIEAERGRTLAWECTIDTVVQEKEAAYGSERLSENDMWWRQDPVLPSTKELSNRTCLYEPDSCSGKNRQDVVYTWNNKTFSIDRRITESMSYELEQVFLGSGFAQGWRSKTGRALEVLQHSSQSVLLIYHRMQSAWNWNVMAAFGTIGDVLTWWMRKYYTAYCQSGAPGRPGGNQDVCDGTNVVGKGTEEGIYYHVVWKLLIYPVVLIIATMLVTLAAAVDETVHRIRLTNSDHADDETDALLTSTSAPADEGDGVAGAAASRS